MTDADRNAFAELLLRLGEAYGETVTIERASVYFERLQPYPLDAVKQAGNQLLDESEFFPKVATFIAKLRPNVEDEGELALGRITESVRRTGYYGRPTLDAADLALVERVWGSWQGCCEQLPAAGTEEYQWERKRFLEMHKAVAAQMQREMQPTLTQGQATALLGDVLARVKAMPH